MAAEGTGSSRRVKLSEADERRFLAAYAAEREAKGKRTGFYLNPDPDDPRHFYDYRAAWKAGGLGSNAIGHGTSDYKLPGHERMYISPRLERFKATGSLRGPESPLYQNTKTGFAAKSADLGRNQRIRDAVMRQTEQ